MQYNNFWHRLGNVSWYLYKGNHNFSLQRRLLHSCMNKIISFKEQSLYNPLL